MAFLFGRSRQKSPSDLVRHLKTALTTDAEDSARLLAQMKLVLQGSHDTDASPEQCHQLITGMIHEDLLLHLARNLHNLPFESRKDAQVIFSAAFRFRPPGTNPIAAELPPALHHVIKNRPEVVITLCRAYDRRESAMPAGTVLRELLKYEAVAAIILADEPGEGSNTGMRTDVPQTGQGVFWRFFDWIDKGAFEVSADAFTTFRDLLTKHKTLISRYLSTNFDLFFARYNGTLVQSSSYVTKRQSIKLLGEILLDRANYTVMTSYVDRGDHLKLCMNLLKDERKMVQYEGFHVFKVFVANPHKSLAVQRILLNNRDRLLRFLPEFLDERTDDEQFLDEKTFLINQIRNMPAQPVDPVARPREGGVGAGVGGPR
ncbi:MAG: hypothetical protein M1817_001981 [Caeruleum heppii]|nr:MAG: hypothetical protein M1817_001981 [Caeruleum heppii]